MATPQTSAPPQANEEADEASDEAEANGERTRLPRVVVRMSDAMFAALKTYCETNQLVATQLGRELLASRIGWNLAEDPDAPGGTTRQKYADDAAREEGKARNRLHNGLLRKALYQAHQGQMKKKPLLTEAATKVVMALAAGKPPLSDLKLLEATLDAAIEAGK